VTDFIDAFRDGLSAAEAADLARQDIDDVFSNLDSQIRKGSDGKLSIARLEYEVEASSWAALVLTFPPKPKETYWAIVAKNPAIEPSPAKQLAKWQMDRRGYPCKLIWAQQEHVCEDRTALESCLAELLRDPIVGERFYALMNLKPQEDGAETPEPEDGQVSSGAAPDAPPEEPAS